MSAVSSIRHSIVGRVARRLLHEVYSFQHRDGRPATYRVAPGVEIQLIPEGEIAEFLTVQQFFEKTEMTLTAALLKPGMTVIDVGANVGVYSILAEKRVGKKGHVWAFEPSRESFERLLRNLELNECQNVNPVQIGLSDQPDSSAALLSDRGYGDAYRYVASSSQVSIASSEAIALTTLDEYASENGITDIDFMKVDVEGNEYRVFLGAPKVLQASPRAVIMFESDAGWCARSGLTPRHSFDFLKELGFKLYAYDRNRWNDQESTLFSSSTIWATRDVHLLPTGA